MNGENEFASRGPLTLKFYGVDDETTSEEEEEEKSESISPICNGNNNHLTINRCYGKRIRHPISSFMFFFLSENSSRNLLTSIPYKTYFEQRERHWTFIPNTDVVVVSVAVSREHHFRLNPFL